MNNDVALAFGHTWPWDHAPPDFFFAYAFLCFVVANVGVLAAVLLANKLDGDVRSLFGPPSDCPLLVGRLPRVEHVYLLAFLSGSLRATLVAGARLAGWLKVSGRGFSVVPDASPRDDVQRRFKERLGGAREPSIPEFRRALNSFTDELARELRAQAERTGLARPFDQRAILDVTALSGVAVAAAAAVIELLVWGWIEPRTWFVTGVFAVSSVACARIVTRKNRQARAYLSWLHENTQALHADVANGRLSEDADVLIVTAMGGLPHQRRDPMTGR